MKVIDLIRVLNDMPHNSEIRVEVSDCEVRNPRPEQVWNDFEENYFVVI